MRAEVASTASTRRRTERGTQSLARRVSMMAPWIRCFANDLNDTPREGSNRSAASMRPITATLVRSSRSTPFGRRAWVRFAMARARG